MNTNFSNFFEYDRKNKTFSFFDEKDYKWSKSVIEVLSYKLRFGEQPLSPFQLIYSDKNFTLTLKGLVESDELKILELLKINGLKQKDPIPNNQWRCQWEMFTQFCKTYTPRFLSNQYEHTTDKNPATNPEEIPLLQNKTKITP